MMLIIQAAHLMQWCNHLCTGCPKRSPPHQCPFEQNEYESPKCHICLLRWVHRRFNIIIHIATMCFVILRLCLTSKPREASAQGQMHRSVWVDFMGPVCPSSLQKLFLAIWDARAIFWRATGAGNEGNLRDQCVNGWEGWTPAAALIVRAGIGL